MGLFFWDHVTQSATAISSFRQLGHFSLHADQCSNITMAERKEFDLFAYIFNREGETEEASREEKHVPLVELTVDNDEDGGSNSSGVVIKQEYHPRRTQPDQLKGPKIDQCSNNTTAKRREFDLFAYIFNRDGEEDGPTTEAQKEDVPLMNFTVNSDEDGGSNSSGVVIKQDQPQSSSRLPRRAQPRMLQEPATDSEKEQDEDEDSSYDEESSSDDEASSSSRRRPVKRGAISRGRHSNVYSFESITFSQLEQKDREGAQRVLDLYRDERQNGYVRTCSRFMSGKCRFMSKSSTDVFRHMKSRHPNEKHPGYKITQYPGFKDLKAHDFVTKPYSQWKRTDPRLAEEALALYTRPQNKKKQKVHLCGHFILGKCQYFSLRAREVKGHMARKHSRALPMIKIVGYPGERERTRHSYDQMTYAELKSKRSKVADQVLKYYYENKFRGKVHLCGSCDYFSYASTVVRDHVARHHPTTTRIYKIIQYPRLEFD